VARNGGEHQLQPVHRHSGLLPKGAPRRGLFTIPKTHAHMKEDHMAEKLAIVFAAISVICTAVGYGGEFILWLLK
jgi:hypothetical protein